MPHSKPSVLLVCVVALGVIDNRVDAFVDYYTDKAKWKAAVGEFNTITFCEYPEYTLITDQYANLGAIFDSPADFIQYSSAFDNDGCGLDCNPDTLVVFARPIHWLGIDHPGLLRVHLYRDGHLVYISPVSCGGCDFMGFVSVHPFDSAFIFDPSNKADIDDLHFGPPPCMADVNLDDVVDTDDLTEVITHWSCGSSAGGEGKDPCVEFDVTRDGRVDVDDLVAVILAWGPCPQ